jgi:TPR repeat protein
MKKYEQFNEKELMESAKIETTYYRALTFCEQSNYKDALQLLHEAAAFNHPMSIYSIGVLYENGYGVRKNYKLAASYYQQAAKLGAVKAIHNLATFYRGGHGVKQDLAQAVALYKKAMKLGEIELAPYNLGTMYFKGIGVRENTEKALELYKISADTGAAVAKFALGVLYYSNGMIDIGKSLINEAAEIGNEHAILWTAIEDYYNNGDLNLVEVLNEMINSEVVPTETYVWLGVVYQNGIGVKVDTQKATQYYLKAIKLEKLVGSIEDPRAYKMLAMQFSGEKGVFKKNKEREDFYLWLVSTYENSRLKKLLERTNI